MKILLTGGGTGGHFYPLISVAQEIKKIILEEKLIEAKFYYMSTTAYNPEVLKANNIVFLKTYAGKWRRYFSFHNFIDPFKTLFGILTAIWHLYLIYPDVVFSKGAYVSMPALIVARLLRIPVIIHESDSHPGKANLWSAKFAQKIALAYPEALQYFPNEKSAVVGNPIRAEVLPPIKDGAHEFLGFSNDLPIILIVGGSQGANRINQTILEILPELLKKYQIIHQTGALHFEEINARSQVIVTEEELRARYKVFPYLDDLYLRMSAGSADLIISRAGSAIFEIACWEVPAILIPIPEEISHDQRTNAFTYARSGGALVIEENNLSASVLLSEINRLMANPNLLTEMKKGAQTFAKPEAGRMIAEEIVKIALSHEA